MLSPVGSHQTDPFASQDTAGGEWAMECPECGEQLDFLDIIVNKATRKVEYRLYICHNPDCAGENLIYNDRNGHPEGGDPSGLY